MKRSNYFGLMMPCIMLLVALAIGPVQAQADDRVVTISPPGERYVDPEILPGGNLMTYQARGAIYLAQLDPLTGLFVTPNGDDVRVDTGAARLLETFNGPEFGIDSDGWALYYAKSHQGVLQIWRATLDASGDIQTAPLTSGSRYQTQLVSRNPRADNVHIAAIHGTWQNGTVVWFDEATPDVVTELTPIENGVNPLRWVDNSYLVTYRQQTGPNRGQVVLLDTATNAQDVITADAGDKTDPYGWFAPDFGGDLLVAAIVDNASVAIYRAANGNTAWQRILTWQPPAESRLRFVSSAEPFVVNGRSYLSLVVKDADDNRQQFDDSEVWLFGLTADGTTGYQERCDSGEVGVSRSDPEVYIGTENVFVYYNIISGPDTTPYEIRRCRSNIAVQSEPVTLPPIATTPTTINAQQQCQWVNPQTTDARIDTELEPHYVCHDPALTHREQLLVFLPGTGADPDDYELFVQEAAAMGLHAIGLSYVNPRSINLQICPRDPDPDCHAKGRAEVIYGDDLLPAVDVDAVNSIQNRLVQLLRYLNTVYPDAGWGHYLDGDTPQWQNIIVSGHSQGAGMAAFIAHDHAVARAVLFAWVDLVRGVVAPWILQPHATPAERIYYFEHVDDHERGQDAKLQMFAAFGFDVWGQATIDNLTSPYNNAHVLLTAFEPANQTARASAGAHNMVVVDHFTPMQGDAPVLRDVWRYLLRDVR